MQTVTYLGQATMPPGPPTEQLLKEVLRGLLRETRIYGAAQVADSPYRTVQQLESSLRRFSTSHYQRYLTIKEGMKPKRRPAAPGVTPQLELDWLALVNYYLRQRRVKLYRIADDPTLTLAAKEQALKRRSSYQFRRYERSKRSFQRMSPRLRASRIAAYARAKVTVARERARVTRIVRARRPLLRPVRRNDSSAVYRRNLDTIRTQPVGASGRFIAEQAVDCRSGAQKYPPNQVRRYFVALAVSAALDQAGIPRIPPRYPGARIEDMIGFVDRYVLPKVREFVPAHGCWLDAAGGQYLRTWRYWAQNELRARKWMDARNVWRPTADFLIRLARRGGRFARPNWIYTAGRGRRPAFVVPAEAARAAR